jgi:membrane associated rhomboid family serine protease
MTSFKNYDLFDYFKAVLPLTLAHLAIPPLSSFQIFQAKGIDVPPESIASFIAFLRSISPSFLLNQDFILKLLLERIDVNTLVHKSNDLWSYRLITHIFVHKDYTHTMNNLISLLTSGSPIFMEFGYFFFYFIFLAGGITASLPVYRAIENSHQHVYAQQNQPTLSNSSLSVSSAIEVFNKGIKKIVTKVASVIGIDRKYICCGSSGGVCAIMGASFIVQCHRSISVFRKVYKIITTDDNSSNNAHVGRDLIDIGLFLLSFQSTINFLSNEYSLFRNQDWSTIRTMFSSGNVDLIDHEAHLQGFAFGAVVTLASYWIGSSTIGKYAFGGAIAAVSSRFYSKRTTPEEYRPFKSNKFRTLK